MRRFLFVILVLAAAILGGLFWLANHAENNPPSDYAQDIEVDLDV